MAKIDLGKRLQAAFGFIGNASPGLKEKGFEGEIKNAQVFVKDSRVQYEEMVLRNTVPKTKIETVLKFGYNGKLQDFFDIYAPPMMCSFRKNKRMETTVVNSNTLSNNYVEGEVVEHYGHAAWDIMMQGLLIDMVNHTYPSGKVQQLIKMFDTDDVWAVESKMFTDHGIRSIYFTDIDSNAVQGFEDTWQFSLSAKSIKPVEFFLRKKDG